MGARVLKKSAVVFRLSFPGSSEQPGALCAAPCVGRHDREQRRAGAGEGVGHVPVPRKAAGGRGGFAGGREDNCFSSVSVPFLSFCVL